MRLTHWLRSLVSRTPEAPRRAARLANRFRPRLEELEGRYCPSGGMLDPTFGSGGEIDLSSRIASGGAVVAIQPADGKIVSVGGFSGSNGHQISITRLNTNGSLDTSFNGTGYEHLSLAKGFYSSALAIQPDGKILVGGFALLSNSSFTSSEFVVERLNPNGTLDKTFANRGVFTWDASSTQDEVQHLAVLSDGSIIAGGVVGGTGGGACVLKLSASGAPVSSFGKGGLAVFSPNNGISVGDPVNMAMAPNGDVILVGTDSNNRGIVLAGSSTTGTLDAGFNNGLGYLEVTEPGMGVTELRTVAIQGNSVVGYSIVVGGDSNDPTLHAVGMLARFSLAGALDTTFGTNGYFNMPDHEYFTNIAVEQDSSLVVSVHNATSGGMLVGHFTPQGQLDTSFGTAGTGFTLIPNGTEVLSLALDASGNIIASAGDQSYPSGAVFARLT